jgi:hypothetical protein
LAFIHISRVISVEKLFGFLPRKISTLYCEVQYGVGLNTP